MNSDDREKLRRHHQATIGLFVAFWICCPLAILALEFGAVSPLFERSLIGTIFGVAIVLVLLQFRHRCPSCRARLGLQWSLGIPRRCGRCGERLRDG